MNRLLHRAVLVGLSWLVSSGMALAQIPGPSVPVTAITTAVTNTQGPTAPGAATATKSNLIGCQFVAAGVTFTDGQQGAVSCNAKGEVVVGGAIASGATDAGNPVKVGGVFNTTNPTLTDGQRGNIQLDLNGDIRALSILKQVAGADGVSNSNTGFAIGQTNGSTNILPNIAPLAFNGTSWDRTRTIVGAVAAGTGTVAVAVAPTSASTGAITPVVSAAAEGSHVLKASAGNLYSLVVTSGASAGYVMIFNATSAPADGAVTPTECIVIAANSTISLNYSGPPEAFATGITAVFSTSGCFTKTISATAFFSGKVALNDNVASLDMVG
jgi:hypothetical protein